MNFHKTGADLRLNAKRRRKHGKKTLARSRFSLSVYIGCCRCRCCGERLLSLLRFLYDFFLFHLPQKFETHTHTHMISRIARNNGAHTSGGTINLSTFYATIISEHRQAHSKPEHFSKVNFCASSALHRPIEITLAIVQTEPTDRPTLTRPQPHTRAIVSV